MNLRKLQLILIIVFLLLTIFTWKEVFALAQPPHLRVSVLDIGQGDSIFIKTPSNRTMLVDGGINRSVLGKLSQELPFWQRSIDVVMLSHPDADHVQGLLSVLKKYKVGYIVWTGMEREGQVYQEWVALVESQERRGAKVVTTKAGTKILSGGTVMEVLYPFEDIQGRFFKKDTNDTSIVSRLDFNETSMLFTGDISSKVELAVLNENISTDILKVAHHGSKYSSSTEFLKKVQPGIAVVSAGRQNSYGHPTPEVLQRMAEFGITVMRTDRDGDVVITTDGEHIKLK